MPAQSFILATAGHVDHGKSALVLALTGTDPDRLPEEKARGITIDLGFAHLDLPAPPGAAPGVERFSCGLVDVPGHEDFVKNMVAGVGSIDLALLVIAADDGWMPQTEEHLQILEYLGVARAVIALTKIDLAPAGAEPRLVEAVRQRLADSSFALAPIVPTSVATGRGLDALREALAGTLAGTPAPPDLARPRLWIDRVFVLPGAGTIVTGTLIGGSIGRGDAVVIQPGGRRSRVRTCHSHGREAERVPPGTRTALNLPDLGLDELHRGQVVTLEAFGGPTETLDVVLEKSTRLAGTGLPAARPLENGAVVRVHLGSACVPARIQLLRPGPLGPGARGLAQLRLEAPVHAWAGDRFVVRDAAEQSTLAGGRILDADARRAHARDPERLALLDACAAAPADPLPFLRFQLHREGPQRSTELLRRSRFPAVAVERALIQLQEAGEIVRPGALVAPAAAWKAALDDAIRRIDEHHAARADLPGLPLSDLRAAMDSRPGLRLGFEELVAALALAGYPTHGAVIRRSNHRPSLPAELQAAGRRLRETLAQRLLDPPARAEIAPDPVSQQALRFLIRSGEVVELGPDLVLTAEAFVQARNRVRVGLRQRGTATVSDLRQLLGTTRRVIVPLLERLDRDGVTLRDGDRRRLAP